jgi:hypothetical protein
MPRKKDEIMDVDIRLQNDIRETNGSALMVSQLTCIPANVLESLMR